MQVIVKKSIGCERTYFKPVAHLMAEYVTLLFDGGSSTNVVSEEMVTKLSLSTEPHPKPYKIQWFKNGNEVSVSKRCLVSFSIEKSYQD